MAKIRDPRPSERKIQLMYARGDRITGFRILSCTGEFYDLTRWENFLIRNKWITFQSIDRRLTKIAHFDKDLVKREDAIRQGISLEPCVVKDPRTNKPVLLTSAGSMHYLTYLERALLFIKSMSLQELNEKVIINEQ